ncbi:hypothetical protein FMM05_16835 [Flavobacterium zepuense]|uniref:Response regulatory domain-containing protein n=1 Tax=Flavobacterium zepuense TaxID=2593302 RepID=A0A552UWH1_9FLAO|nr:hypothetical protein [Flavobacterium zepuense]TRW22545.1 hypothetical protein FMM05_16835 [Flavobacterium zepuense]
MNKDGKILLLDVDANSKDFLCRRLKGLGYKNDVLCFSTSEEAGDFLRNNMLETFILLQNSDAPGIQVPDTRNMIYMHEKFRTDVLPYMFLVLTKNKTPLNALHTFVHCYYKPVAPEEIIETLENVIDFWKDHVFPPKVAPFSGN